MMTLTAKRATSIKVKAIRKIINTLPAPKTREAKEALKNLKKSVSNYASYEGDQTKAKARENLADIIIRALAAKL